MAGRDPAFQALRAPFALGNTPKHPANVVPPKVAPQPPSCPAPHARLAPQLQAPTAPGLEWTAVTHGCWEAAPSPCPSVSRMQPEQWQSSTREKQLQRTDTAHTRHTREMLLLFASVQGLQCSVNAWGFMIRLGRHPQQPKPEQVSLVNINFISFKAKLTRPLQCKNVL